MISKSHRDPDVSRMWPMGVAIGVTLGVALVIVTIATLLAWRRFEPDIDEATVRDFLQLVVIIVGLVAGGGGSVALVVAYRRQKVNERAEARSRRAELREATRLMNERFQAASTQLGHEQPAVRLAGAHAMAHLADDWEDQRQMCIDVLCSLARMPAEPEPPGDEPQRLAEWHAAREVPRTILRTITAHLRADGAEVSWHGHDFDLHGVKIDRHVDFRGFTFNDGTLTFDDAEILPDGFLDFEGASFSGGVLNLARATLHHPVIFTRAVFSGGVVQADKIEIESAGFLVFTDATFSGTDVQLDDSGFTGGIVDFNRATFEAGRVSFSGARFSGSNVGFNMAAFVGGDVAFHEAQFTGGIVDLSNPEVWSAPPKGLPDPVPAQLKLPPEERIQWCATVGKQRCEDRQDESSTKHE